MKVKLEAVLIDADMENPYTFEELQQELERALGKELYLKIEKFALTRVE